MRTGLAQKFLLAGLALSSTFVGLEFAVRAFRLAPDIGIIELNTPHATYRAVANPILKFVPKPNTGDINEQGLRDHSYAIEKPPGTFRILVLGDSIGFGFCTQDASIPLDSIFAKVLERRLNARSDLGFERFEIINFSVTGYDTRQEVEFLATKGIAFSPDLVLVAYHLNDKEQRRFWESRVLLGDSSSLAHRQLIIRSHLARLVWYRLPLLGETLGAPRVPASESGHTNRVSDGFQRLRALSKRHDFATAVIVFPYFVDYANYPLLLLHEEVAAVARLQGFAVLDLLDAFRHASSGDFRELRDPCVGHHPNTLGHGIAAESIERFVLEEGLLAER